MKPRFPFTVAAWLAAPVATRLAERRGPADFRPPPTGAGLARRSLWVLATAGITAAVVVIPPWGAGPPADQCSPGVIRRAEECTGVTDGSFFFAPQLSTVEKDIYAENRWVEKHGRYVTVALLAPLTAGGNEPITRIVHEVEGTYVAQYRANHEGVVGDSPHIRLALANEGSQEQDWAPVTAQLKGMVSAPDHLVAVVGLGISTDFTVFAEQALSRDGLPMVESVITADGLDTTGLPAVVRTSPQRALQLGALSGPIAGLTRVSPSNSTEVAALANVLPGQPGLRSAALVIDDNQQDLYNWTIAADFSAQLHGYLAPGLPAEPYDGAPGSEGLKNQFNTISSNVLCGPRPPDMLLYAGRDNVLPDFIGSLRQRPCDTNRLITVVTGSDAAALRPFLPAPAPGDAPVSVIYPALADPGELGTARLNHDLPLYQRFLRAFSGGGFSGRGFAAADLADGWAIMTHDAMLAAARAIQEPSSQQPGLPSTGDVLHQIYLDSSPANGVPGAGGAFWTDTASGDAIGRSLPVMELSPTGSLTVLRVYVPPTPAS